MNKKALHGRRSNTVKLYNAYFPFWILLLFPQVWLIVLPGNFIIDSLVLIVSLLILKVADKKQWYKQYILKIYAFGMLSDIAGGAFLLLIICGFRLGTMGDELYLTVPALMVSAVLIFVLNYFITFKAIDKPLRRKFSLIFAIVTAPYTFLIPSSWLY